MQIKVDLECSRLMKIVRTLPAQLNQLKTEIEKEAKATKPKVNLEALLLDVPVATKKQLKTIWNNCKAINQWQTN